MKKVLCPGEALIDFISTSAGKSLKETEGLGVAGEIVEISLVKSRNNSSIR